MTTGDHRDRSVGLIVFGVIELLIGGCTALLIPLVVAVTLLSPAPSEGDAPTGLGPVAPSLLLYGTVAAAFIWIGLGSIRARKWARAVMLSLSWVWLITGVAAMLAYWWLIPRIWGFAAPDGLPAGTAHMVVVTTSLFLGFIYILLPLAFVLFYRSPDVVATCEARDPRRSWVDDCPSPVVSLVLVYAIGAVSCLAAPAYNFAFPLFGFVADGWIGAMLWSVVLAVLLYLVRATARREPRSWNVAMTASLAAAVSSTLSAALVPFGQWLDRMALPADQLRLVAGLGELSPSTMVALSLATWVSWIAFLIWTRRFFPASEAP